MYMYWPPEAELLEPVCIGEVRIPDSASMACPGWKYWDEQVPPVQHAEQSLALWTVPAQVWPEGQHEPPSWEQVWVGAPETYSYAPMSQAAPTGRVVPSKSVVKCVLKEVPTSIAGEDACK